MKIVVETIYELDDTEFNSDYIGVRVYIDGELVKSYGDYYHDKGDIRAASFVEGVKYLRPFAEVSLTNVNEDL